MKKPVGRPPKNIQVGWRVPKSLRDKMRRAAKRNGVTTSAEIRRRLEASLRLGGLAKLARKGG